MVSVLGSLEGSGLRRPGRLPRPFRLAFPIAVLLVLQSALLAASEVRPGRAVPTAQQVLELALQRIDRNDASSVELAFKCVVDTTVESLNAQHEAVSVSKLRLLRYPLAGVMFDEVVERDGQPLAAKDAVKERKRKQRFLQSAAQRSSRGGERPGRDKRGVRFDRRMMERYEVSLQATEAVRGQVCWVLAYEPRSGPLPRSEPMDEALNRSTGRLWIAQLDHALVRATFRLQSPVRYLWGILATLRAADGGVEFGRVAPGVWLPSRFRIDLDLKLLGGVKSVRRRVRSEWSGYRAVAPDTGAT